MCDDEWLRSRASFRSPRKSWAFHGRLRSKPPYSALSLSFRTPSPTPAERVRRRRGRGTRVGRRDGSRQSGLSVPGIERERARRVGGQEKFLLQANRGGRSPGLRGSPRRSPRCGTSSGRSRPPEPLGWAIATRDARPLGRAAPSLRSVAPHPSLLDPVPSMLSPPPLGTSVPFRQ